MKAKSKTLKLLSWVLVLAMVISLMPLTPVSAIGVVGTEGKVQLSLDYLGTAEPTATSTAQTLPSVLTKDQTLWFGVKASNINQHPGFVEGVHAVTICVAYDKTVLQMPLTARNLEGVMMGKGANQWNDDVYQLDGADATIDPSGISNQLEQGMSLDLTDENILALKIDIGLNRYADTTSAANYRFYGNASGNAYLVYFPMKVLRTDVTPGDLVMEMMLGGESFVMGFGPTEGDEDSMSAYTGQWNGEDVFEEGTDDFKRNLKSYMQYQGDPDLFPDPNKAEDMPVEVTVQVDGAAVTNKTVTLQDANNADATPIATTVASGKYTATGKDNKTYKVLVDGVDTGKTLAKGSTSATVEYFTFSWTAQTTGNNAGTVVAKVNNTAISSGAELLKGTKVALSVEVSGTNHSSTRTYAWSGGTASKFSSATAAAPTYTVDAKTTGITCALKIMPVVSIAIDDVTKTTVGQTLTATITVTNEEGFTPTVYWQVGSDKKANEGTGGTYSYTIKQADLNKTIKARVEYPGYGTSAAYNSANSVTVGKAAMPGTVTISNTTPVYGDKLTATYTGAVSKPTIKWYVGGTEATANSDGSFTVGKTAVGKTIVAKASDTANYSGSADSAATTAVAKKAIDLSGVVLTAASIKLNETGSKDVSATATVNDNAALVAGDVITITATATYTDVATEGTKTGLAIKNVSYNIGSANAGDYYNITAPTSATGTVSGKTFNAIESVTLTVPAGTVLKVGDTVDPAWVSIVVSYKDADNETLTGAAITAGGFNITIGDKAISSALAATDDGKAVTVTKSDDATATKDSTQKLVVASAPTLSNVAAAAGDGKVTVTWEVNDNHAAIEAYAIAVAGKIPAIEDAGEGDEPATTPSYSAPTAAQINEMIKIEGWTLVTEELEIGAPVDGMCDVVLAFAIEPSEAVTSAEITGLTNGQEYAIVLGAGNAAGETVAEPVNATPVAPVSGGVSAPTVKSLTVNPTRMSGVIGDSKTITATVEPTSTSVSWTSSNTSVATVKNGVVTFVAKGTAVITARAGNMTAVTRVTVVDPKDSLLDKECVDAYASGYMDGSFRPNDHITRAEVASMFSRIMVEKMDPNATYVSPYEDVYAGQWFNDSVVFMSNLGVFTGVGYNCFQPDAFMTRAQAAVMLAKIEKIDVSGTAECDFTDADTIPEWAQASVAVLSELGVYNGYDDGSFRPNAYITRAEMVTLINSLMRVMSVKTVSVTPNDVAETHWAYEAIVKAMNTRELEK